ncbi:hypothetical protein AVEN_101125-1 [Araneus ventricosus]|uniref:Uncharacterized protein n=1 Tax=Araneus ventricosus TaxID=182803 RepID=A0A4Y2T3N5_ARAVE|nr:hypothetical protein AVEN_101125-1 [Araneus ventricosus]
MVASLLPRSGVQAWPLPVIPYLPLKKSLPTIRLERQESDTTVCSNSITQKRNEADKRNLVCGLDPKIADQYQIFDLSISSNYKTSKAGKRHYSMLELDNSKTKRGR